MEKGGAGDAAVAGGEGEGGVRPRAGNRQHRNQPLRSLPRRGFRGKGVLLLMVDFEPARIGMHADMAAAEGHGVSTFGALATFDLAIVVNPTDMSCLANSGIRQFLSRVHRNMLSAIHE